ncbi:hypothetical protein BZG02_19275 [Labilibaculum filiforme]|uniref:DUF3822 domain-containing protein n=1 Tax=Labilibaculum filiforme TaxID=1940526 RepID=A0A2N3HQT7_9BACT|nr:DUF3822 family protein [Labilibaculum filiforme]PKQ60407.1 hypothetical protein BZG02_19275 [Labilibaculum filiforme]
MNDLVFVDTSFDKNKTKEYTLSIQVSLDGFSFSILNSHLKCIALNQFIPFKTNSDNNPINSFIEIVRNNELLNLDFKDVSLVWISDKALLIPSEFFSEDFAYESFQLSHHLDKSDCLQWNEITELKAWIVFSFPNNINEFIQSHFKNSILYHHCFPFYKEALNQKIAENHPQVFLNIQNNFFHVIIPDRNGKHFINTFSYSASSDLAYYILNIFKQQKLNNERSKLIIDGLVQEDSQVILLLKKYLGQVEVKLLPSEFRINKSIPHQEYNQFINLLNLSRCE